MPSPNQLDVEAHLAAEITRHVADTARALREVADRIEQTAAAGIAKVSVDDHATYAHIAYDVHRDLDIALANTPLRTLIMDAGTADRYRAGKLAAAGA
ncbi:hypothetical protein CHO01_37040 [Cellulomonas hominis]|uniref:Uncharacterized protein n=1 Tax=Cellulomonas hominis TaxID=156981 RepID=A0A511FL48_9CELL|nr:hypothetical protein [Cellulomonas hominis]MBB5474710.1 hypothetical protein [Cellulomonas hominis]NKY06789.1 hypothetical protein [Cellulomonas hominis]GEL48588.1 hypothetical protein CHO01_37040 [Cellulomonas hominis]